MVKKSLNSCSISGIIVLSIFVALSLYCPSSFDALERSLQGMSHRFAPAQERPSGRIALVEIDEKSLTEIGPWPWSRHTIAKVIEILDEKGAMLIGVNLALSEKESSQGLTEVRAFRERFNAYTRDRKEEVLSGWVRENLNRMERGLDSDGHLVAAVEKSAKVILPAFGLFQGHGGKPLKGADALVRENGLTRQRISPSLEDSVSTPVLHAPFPELARVVRGLGHGHATCRDETPVSAHPMFISYRGALIPSFPLRIAIASLNRKPGQAIVDGERIRLGDIAIPLCNGEMIISYDGGRSDYPRYSFVDILRAGKVPGVIKGRIVLVGFNTSEQGRVSTPVDPRMSEGELTARILDNILSKNFISRPPETPHIELSVLVLIGGFTAMFFPRLGQLARLLWMVGLTSLLLISDMALFAAGHIWVRSVHVAGAVFCIYAVVSIIRWLTAERLTRDSMETNRLLGLSFQSQGLLDMAFDKFRKLPLDMESRDLIYNLGLEYERRRMINKAVTAYEYLNRGGGFRDLDQRIPKLKEWKKSSNSESQGAAREASILDEVPAGTRSQVGRYEIVGQLGRGSMGLVYKALDPKINRLLAIKTIRFSDEFDGEVIEEIKERFFREAEIAGQLSHPSIVTIYDVGDDGDLTYMAMEFLEGDDLENFISKKTLLPFRRVLDVVASVAEALEFAHKAEVIHRDIKPANIMLLEGGGVKVTDFGIAKAISSSRTKTGVILGTPNYMSPEQIMGQKIDHCSDIFSLGVLFFQLLTGETPFHGDNLSSLLYQITQVKQPPVREYNPNIPKICEQIIDKALAKNPKARFQTAGEMAKYVKLLALKLDRLKTGRPSQD